MKILDRYILTTYLRTFLSVFIILMLIFVLQTIWLYISELAGKELDFLIVGKFLLYFSPKLIPLVLPLTILLASIMVFGNFAENYEFSAMKSTGISLQRAMRGLSIFIFILAIGTFFFSNNVIPWAEYESYNLRKNIAKLKPAMAIAEGQFNEIGEYNIKVEKKSGEKGEFLESVVIHKKAPNRVGNYTVIVSKTGELISSENSNMLQLVLYNGHFYEEIFSKDPKQSVKKPHVRSAFDKYIINVDLEGLNDVDLDDKNYSNKYNMLGVADLSTVIDSLYEDQHKNYQDISQTLYNRTAIKDLNSNIELKKDTINDRNVLEFFSVKEKIQILNLTSNTVNSTTQIIKTKAASISKKNKLVNKHIIALHEKFALGFACVILFFVGAPLGALIRKGGIGLPMIIAILLFLTYHFIGIFAKNSAQEGSINSIFGTWLSTLIMFPLGIFLTSRATNDRGLFDFDSIIIPIKKLFKITPKNESNLNLRLVEGFNEDKLIDVIKNYNNYDYDETIIPIAYQLLKEKGLSDIQIQAEGIVIDTNYFASKTLVKDYSDYALTTFISYSIGAVLILLFFILKNNKLEELAQTLLNLSMVAFVFFIIYSIVSSVVLIRFYKSLKFKTKTPQYISLIFGAIFYPITYFLIKNKVKQEITKSAIKNIK
ncbi:LptF/LptG family permease [Lacinutrix undariae]